MPPLIQYALVGREARHASDLSQGFEPPGEKPRVSPLLITQMADRIFATWNGLAAWSNLCSSIRQRGMVALRPISSSPRLPVTAYGEREPFEAVGR